MSKDFLDELDSELKDKNINLEDVKKPNTPNKPSENTKNKRSIPKRKQAPKQNNLNNNLLQFPSTNFYLPSLRDKYTRYSPIGGNNETGSKNMEFFQYKDEILIVDCGIQFAEPEMLGATASVPDISFLVQYKGDIQGLVMTHAHLDHIGALKYILPALDYPVIYGTKLTIGIIKKGLEEFNILHHQKFIEVDAHSDKVYNMGKYFKCEFFRVNHSVPDCMGVYIETPNGFKAVGTGDFKIDYTPRLDKPADLSRIGQIGERDITLFMSDSTNSLIPGFSTSEKVVGENLDKIIREHKGGRLIITMFSSWISRVQQIIDSAEKHGKYIFLSGRSMIENITIAQQLGYISSKSGTMRKLTSKNTSSIPLDKQIIITTGSQGEEHSALSRMVEGRHNASEINKGDTVVFSSSIVPGNNNSVVAIINKLLKRGAYVITGADMVVHAGGHAHQEEQKIMLNLVKPKYFAPIYGDIYYRTAHKKIAMDLGWDEQNVLMPNNGEIMDFGPDGKVFKSKVRIPIKELIIDGNRVGVITDHINDARSQMMNSGTLVVAIKADKSTNAIFGHLKIESRGLVYLDEVRNVHGSIIKKTRTIYEQTIKDVPEIEEKDLIKIIRTDLEKHLRQMIDREPMIIPLIITV